MLYWLVLNLGIVNLKLLKYKQEYESNLKSSNRVIHVMDYFVNFNKVSSKPSSKPPTVNRFFAVGDFVQIGDCCFRA